VIRGWVWDEYKIIPCGNEEETKLWYLLNLGLSLDMEMKINFFYGDGHEIAKLVFPLSSLISNDHNNIFSDRKNLNKTHHININFRYWF